MALVKATIRGDIMTVGNPNSIDLGDYVLSLGDSVLRGVAENASGCTVSSVSPHIISREWPEYGYCGEKCILCLSFKTVDNCDGEVSVFVKRQDGDEGFKETPHYEYLNRNHLPGAQAIRIAPGRAANGDTLSGGRGAKYRGGSTT